MQAKRGPDHQNRTEERKGIDGSCIHDSSIDDKNIRAASGAETTTDDTEPTTANEEDSNMASIDRITSDAFDIGAHATSDSTKIAPIDGGAIDSRELPCGSSINPAISDPTIRQQAKEIIPDIQAQARSGLPPEKNADGEADGEEGGIEHLPDREYAEAWSGLSPHIP